MMDIVEFAEKFMDFKVQPYHAEILADTNCNHGL